MVGKDATAKSLAIPLTLHNSFFIVVLVPLSLGLQNTPSPLEDTPQRPGSPPPLLIVDTFPFLPQMVEEDMAAKSDPPPKYEDVLDSEAPPPSYYTVVSEATGGAASTTSPAPTRSKLEPQPPKVLTTPGPRRSPAFRRWLGRPGILQTLVSPSMFRAPRGASPPTPPQSAKSKMSLALRRSSSTPSLAGLDMQPSMARSPSSPSLCDGCGWF